MAGLSVVGLGVDAVDLDRVRLALERTPTLVDRIYTPAERAYCEARRDPTERFAVRFAAKEAALKALGIGVFRVPLTDIEVMRADSGAPSLVLVGAAAALADDAGVAVWHLTLSHTAHTAVAVALALGG